MDSTMTDDPHGLVRSYYREVVRPIILARWPGLLFAVGRLGTGSDVLGFDDEMSTDHDWGLRLTLLVAPSDVDDVRFHLERTVPAFHRGSPTRFPTTRSPRPVLGIEVTSVAAFLLARVGVDSTKQLEAADWLAMTGQGVLEVIAGPVFEDTAGEITAWRDRLAWYPPHVERFALAAAWWRVEEEFPFVGRTAARGDDLGSRVIAARIVRSIMQIGYLLDRRWPPYAKWFGTAFRGLPSAVHTMKQLNNALSVDHWPERERALASAVEAMAAHQALHGLPIIEPVIQPFFDRPFLSVSSMHTPLLEGSDVSALAGLAPVGPVELWSDSAPALLDSEWRRAVVDGWMREAGR